MARTRKAKVNARPSHVPLLKKDELAKKLYAFEDSLYNLRGEREGMRQIQSWLQDLIDEMPLGVSDIPVDQFRERLRDLRKEIYELDRVIGNVASRTGAVARDLKKAAAERPRYNNPQPVKPKKASRLLNPWGE